MTTAPTPAEPHSANPATPKETIRVQVRYVGSQPFNDGFSVTATLLDVKLAAMRHFDLEAAMEKKYVLKENGIEQPDSLVLGTLGEKHLSFDLSLKNEVPKG